MIKNAIETEFLAFFAAFTFFQKHNFKNMDGGEFTPSSQSHQLKLTSTNCCQLKQ